MELPLKREKGGGSSGTLHVELNDLHVTMSSENGTSRQNSTADGGGSVPQTNVPQTQMSQLDADLMFLDLDGQHPLIDGNSGGTLRPRPSPGAQTLPTSASAPSLVAAGSSMALTPQAGTNQQQIQQPMVQPGTQQPIVQGPPQPMVQGPPQPMVQGPPQGPPQPMVQGPPQGPLQPMVQGPPQGPLQPMVQGPPQGPLQPMVQGPPQPMVQGPPQPMVQGPPQPPQWFKDPHEDPCNL